MRCMKRNKQRFYYANFDSASTTEVTDEFGNYTGESSLNYTEPTEFHASISSAIGDTEITLFGKDLQYDKTICFDKVRPEGFDEYSILWVDKEPYENGIQTGHDYIVRKIAKSLNGFWLVAIAKAEVT